MVAYIEQILNIEISEISESTSTNTIDNWDSLQHMNLISAIEEEFEITLLDNEILEMINYSKILEVLSKHLM